MKAGDRLGLGAGVGVDGEVKVEGTRGWRVGLGLAEAGGRRRMEVRFVPGVQEDWFTEEARKRLMEAGYQVTTQSDRMGMRLAGPELGLRAKREMVSQPVARGSIQVPPDGQPIVLLAERQTLGGYPQIGHVATVDLDRLAQAAPGTEVGFIPISVEEARGLWKEQAKDLAWLRAGLLTKR